jgi:prepilin-type N-terminal cleavage/methylation domain-containing protein
MDSLRRKIMGPFGFTLVELMAAILIAGIATSGLVAAYINGINYWRSTSEMATLRNEGGIILSFIEGKVRAATFMQIRSYAGSISSMLDIDYLRRNGDNPIFPASIQFYYVSGDHSLRMNDLSGTHGIYNLQILPMEDIHYDVGEAPFLSVAHCVFIADDPLPPADPENVGYKLITVNLSLADSRGDTLTLSKTVCSSN